MHLSRTRRLNALRTKALEAYANGHDRRAFRLFRRLANMGSAEGAWRVASMYRNGEGVKANSLSATKWGTLAAELHGTPLPAELDPPSQDLQPPAAPDHARKPGSRKRHFLTVALLGSVVGAVAVAATFGPAPIRAADISKKFALAIQHLRASTDFLIEEAATEDRSEVAANRPETDGPSVLTELDHKPTRNQAVFVTPTSHVQDGLKNMQEAGRGSHDDLRLAETPPSPAVRVASPETGATPARIDRPTIVLAARANILVRVFDASNNTLLDRRFQPGDTFTVPSRDGLLVSTDTPNQLDIIVDGRTVRLPAELRPGDRVALDAAQTSVLGQK